MKQAFSIHVVTLICILGLLTNANTQSLARQVQVSGGSSENVDGILYRQTIGQPYSTQTENAEEATLRQGFAVGHLAKLDPLQVDPDWSIDLQIDIQHGQIFIHSSQLHENTHIHVFNLNGERIYQKSLFKTPENVISYVGWAVGHYIISIQDDLGHSHKSRLTITK